MTDFAYISITNCGKSTGEADITEVTGNVHNTWKLNVTQFVWNVHREVSTYKEIEWTCICLYHNVHSDTSV